MTAPTAPLTAAPARSQVTRRIVGELARFGSVGAVAYVIDVGLMRSKSKSQP